jgi:hypothetical protein
MDGLAMVRSLAAGDATGQKLAIGDGEAGSNRTRVQGRVPGKTPPQADVRSTASTKREHRFRGLKMLGRGSGTPFRGFASAREASHRPTRIVLVLVSGLIGGTALRWGIVLFFAITSTVFVGDPRLQPR